MGQLPHVAHQIRRRMAAQRASAGHFCAHMEGLLPPHTMQLALRRRLRLPLPLCLNRCGPGPGCGQRVVACEDHAIARPRTGLLARRAKIVERAEWPARLCGTRGCGARWANCSPTMATTALGVPSNDRRRLDVVAYGAAPCGGAMCCDATLVSPLTRAGKPKTAPLTMTGPRSGSPSVANSRFLQNSGKAGHDSSCWVRRSLEYRNPTLLERLAPTPGATSPAGLACGGESGLGSSLVGHAARGRATDGREYGARAGLARPAASLPERRSSTRATARIRSPGQAPAACRCTREPLGLGARPRSCNIVGS